MRHTKDAINEQEVAMKKNKSTCGVCKAELPEYICKDRNNKKYFGLVYSPDLKIKQRANIRFVSQCECGAAYFQVLIV